MLPFLGQKRQQDGGSVSVSSEGKVHSGEEDMGLISAAEDLCKAIERKDHKSIAAALKAAFEILESEPHTEGEYNE